MWIMALHMLASSNPRWGLLIGRLNVVTGLAARVRLSTRCPRLLVSSKPHLMLHAAILYGEDSVAA
jgi:hypothetical protein